MTCFYVVVTVELLKMNWCCQIDNVSIYTSYLPGRVNFNYRQISRLPFLLLLMTANQMEDVSEVPLLADNF